MKTGTLLSTSSHISTFGGNASCQSTLKIATYLQNHPSEVLLVAVIILYGYSKDEWFDACVAISIFSLT